jgi:hypothetical protein
MPQVNKLRSDPTLTVRSDAHLQINLSHPVSVLTIPTSTRSILLVPWVFILLILSCMLFSILPTGQDEQD